jgi:hypothetical protein
MSRTTQLGAIATLLTLVLFACERDGASMDATGPITSADTGDATAGAMMEASAGRSADESARGGNAGSSGAAAGANVGSAAGSGLSGTGAAGSTMPAAADGGSGGRRPQPMAAGSAASNAGSAAPKPTGPVRVYLAGDSTVSTYADTASPHDQAGWGQMLHEYFRDGVAVDNRAIGGRTARRFIDLQVYIDGARKRGATPCS